MIRCPVYEKNIPQTVSRITRPNIGLFVLILMHFPCWFQNNIDTGIDTILFNICDIIECFFFVCLCLFVLFCFVLFLFFVCSFLFLFFVLFVCLFCFFCLVFLAIFWKHDDTVFNRQPLGGRDNYNWLFVSWGVCLFVCLFYSTNPVQIWLLFQTVDKINSA